MQWSWKRSLILSLLVHIVIAVAALLAPKTSPDSNVAIEISLDEKSASKLEMTAPHAKTAVVPENALDKESKKKATVMTDQFQRVKEETQARLRGRTNNTLLQNNNSIASSGNTGKEIADNQIQRKTQQQLEKDEEGEGTRKDPYSDYKPLPGFQGGPSRVDDSLDSSIRYGTITALNSDRYTFYSFFARIEDQTRFRWVQKLGDAVEKLDRSRTLIGRRHWVTELEFLITPRGDLVKVLILKESGMKSFDLAAINAFKEAKTFPNPPKEMIQEDGLIHLQFAFDFDFTPPALSSGPVEIN